MREQTRAQRKSPPLPDIERRYRLALAGHWPATTHANHLRRLGRSPYHRIKQGRQPLEQFFIGAPLVCAGLGGCLAACQHLPIGINNCRCELGAANVKRCDNWRHTKPLSARTAQDVKPALKSFLPLMS